MNRELAQSVVRLLKVEGHAYEFSADEVPDPTGSQVDSEEGSTAITFPAMIGMHRINVEVIHYAEGWLIGITKAGQVLWSGNIEESWELAVSLIRWRQVHAHIAALS